MVGRLLSGLAVILAVMCLAGFSLAQTEWAGEYYFGENGGETVGGSKIYIAHTITVSESDGRLVAKLYSQGFQTSRDIIADAKPVDSKMKLYFREKGPDNVFGDFEKGDLLLTLEFKNGRLLTVWGKFTPVLDQNAENGRVRFEKEEIKETKESPTPPRKTF